MSRSQSYTEMCLTPEEEQKLQAFQQSIEVSTRQRYAVLRQRLEQEILTPVEQEELIELTEAIEHINVERMEFLTAVANNHHLTLAAIVRLLNIRPLVS